MRKQNLLTLALMGIGMASLTLYADSGDSGTNLSPPPSTPQNSTQSQESSHNNYQPYNPNNQPKDDKYNASYGVNPRTVTNTGRSQTNNNSQNASSTRTLPDSDDDDDQGGASCKHGCSGYSANRGKNKGNSELLRTKRENR